MNQKKRISFAQFYHKFGVAVLLLLVVVAAAILSPNFLTGQNITNVFRQITVIMILGCGCTFVLISGNINIAYDGILVCTGVIGAMTMAATGNLILAIIASVFVGMVFGYCYGLLVTKFEVPGFIVGLAFTSIGSGIILLLTKGKAVPKTSLGNFKVLGQGYIGFVPICVIIMLAILLICHIILTRSRFGMKVMAIGGNKEAAIASGINVNRVVRMIYVIDGITCAIGAVVFMSRINSGDPSAGVGTCFDVITAVCVGGVSISGGAGTVVGTLIGAAIVGVLDNLLNLMNVNASWQNVVSGIVILLAITIDVFVKQSLSKNAKQA